MKDWIMFSELQALKNKGFKKTAVAKKLDVNFRTVDKYWEMAPEDFAEATSIIARFKRPEIYRQLFIQWLQENPDMSSAQIYDWLLERHDENIDFAERTLRRYIRELREQEKIPKSTPQRQYEALADPAIGYQAQVDIGEIKLVDLSGKSVKLYCFAMVLSHSRYKYIRWQEKPFTTVTFIEAHEKAFAFFGGQPKEIVYDQDRVLAVSENHGDIIYTERFQTYIGVKKFKVFLCRGSDPESKGRVESVEKYVKNNFAKHRTFMDIDSFNDDCMSWLERTGNGKKHQTTHKIPVEVFALEREHLTPVSSYDTTVSDTSVTYIVKKDNTVVYRTNRYCVPKGTYQPGKRVRLHLMDTTTLLITDLEENIIYARHTLSTGNGQLIPIKEANRELNKTLSQLQVILDSHFPSSKSFESFTERIKKEKPRYFKDQLSLIRKTCEHPDLFVYKDMALDYCIANSLYTASDFRAAAEYFHETHKSPARASPELILSKKYPEANPKIRDINEYKRAMEA